MSKMSEYLSRVMPLLVVCVLLLGTVSCASKSKQDAPGVSSSSEGAFAEVGRPDVQPLAAKYLIQMGDELKEAKRFTVNVQITNDMVLPEGALLKVSGTSQIALQRPNKFASTYMGDMSERKFWFDGETFTLLDKVNNLYAKANAPTTIDGVLDYLMEEHDLHPPLADFFYSDPVEGVKEGVVSGFYIGKSTIEDTPCHHLLFTQENIDWQIWIEEGKRLLPKKLVITYKTLEGSPQYSAVFSNWKLNPGISNSTFVASVPKDASRITFMNPQATS